MPTLHRCRTPATPTRDVMKIMAGGAMGVAVVGALLVGIAAGMVAHAAARLRGRTRVAGSRLSSAAPTSAETPALRVA